MPDESESLDKVAAELVLRGFIYYSCLFQIRKFFTKDINPKYLVDEKGHKTAVVRNIKDYQNLMEFIEDLEDAYDPVKAEKKARVSLPTKNSARNGSSREL
jgi:hypothetical protein